MRSNVKALGREYVKWWLLYLLLITCVPLSTIIVGRFSNLAPSIWLYAGNTILISAVAFRLIALTPDIKPGDPRNRQASLILLIASSVLAVGWSFVNASQALWAFALNLAAPAITHWKR
jgi:hypothetical protein